MKWEPPEICGDGTQMRDFTFIEDIVEANVTLLESDAADGQAVNIGSTDNIEIKTLAEEIRDQLAPESELEYSERCDADSEHTHADTELDNELLGYEASHTIREVVGKFTEWYEANREWYDPLVRRSRTYPEVHKASLTLLLALRKDVPGRCMNR